MSHRVAVGVLAGAALLFWWPILVAIETRIAGGVGDPLLVAYIVTWVAEHLTDGLLWHPPYFFPDRYVLAYADHLIGLGILSWPLHATGVSPGAIANLLSMAASALTSLAVYWWLTRLKFSRFASVAAALAVTYGAWRYQQLAHVQHLFTPGLVAALAVLTPGRARAPTGAAMLAAGVLLAIQSICTPSLTVYVMPLVGTWIGAIALTRRWSVGEWCRAALIAAPVVLVNLPIAAVYDAGVSLPRSVAEIEPFSVQWRDWISAAPRHWLYGDLLTSTRGWERELFPGFLFAAVLGIGTVASVRASQWRSTALPGLLTVLVACWAATGLADAGDWRGWHLPYELLYRLAPGGERGRVPARFVTLAALFAAPVVAVGWQVIEAFAARRLTRGAMRTALGAGVLLVLVEASPSAAWYEVIPPPSPATPAGVTGNAMIVLPLSSRPAVELERMWAARWSGIPTANGYAGRVSAVYDAVARLQRLPADAVPHSAVHSWLRHHGIDVIVSDPGSSTIVDLSRLERLGEGVFRIPPSIPPAVTRFRPGDPIGVLALGSGWSYPEHDEADAWVWSVQRRMVLTLPVNHASPAHLVLRVRRLEGTAPSSLVARINGQTIGVAELPATPAEIRFRLPELMTGRGWITVELEGPEPTRHPGNPDPRRLGLCLFEIRVE